MGRRRAPATARFLRVRSGCVSICRQLLIYRRPQIPYVRRMTVSPGLRERKNARTREAIERAALELALEQGYDATTVDEIAARAEVAPRTVYVRYATKDAIVFG